jgi:hypothetical protein
MHRRRLWLALGLVILALLVSLRPAYAAPVQEDEFVVGDDLTLRGGEHIDGDLVIVGGSLTMLAGSRVDGSVIVLGGDVEINGSVQGDAVALGGNVALHSQARIAGDLVALGGQVRRDEGAQTGEVVQGLSIRDARFWRGLRAPLFFPQLSADPATIAWNTLTALILSLVIAALGVVVVAFWPTQTTEVGHTILRSPLPSLSIGCLLYPLAGSLILFLLITICLALFVPVIVLLLVAASLLGWIALGVLWGRWLTRRTGWRRATPVMVAGVGVFTLSFISIVAGAVPCVGSLLVLAATSLGLGAVALSRFGTTRYPRRPTAPE